MSASARTSYTRVDVDSSPVPDYPPLPPLPIAFAVQDVPVATAPVPANDSTPIPQTPQVSLTFLLVSGNRKTQTFEPETTVGRVKELVWNAWPARDAGSSSFPSPLHYDRLTSLVSIVFRLPRATTYPSPSVIVRPRLARRTSPRAVLSPNSVSGKDIAGRRYAPTYVTFFLLPFSSASPGSPSSIAGRVRFPERHEANDGNIVHVDDPFCVLLVSYADRRFDRRRIPCFTPLRIQCHPDDRPPLYPSLWTPVGRSRTEQKEEVERRHLETVVLGRCRCRCWCWHGWCGEGHRA